MCQETPTSLWKKLKLDKLGPGQETITSFGKISWQNNSKTCSGRWQFSFRKFPALCRPKVSPYEILVETNRDFDFRGQFHPNKDKEWMKGFHPQQNEAREGWNEHRFPSLKLIARTWKGMLGRRSFLFGMSHFQELGWFWGGYTVTTFITLVSKSTEKTVVKKNILNSSLTHWTSRTKTVQFYSFVHLKRQEIHFSV